MEIERKDERNIAISNRSKAKAYDLMIFVFGALMLSFALMGVDLVLILLLVFAYLFVVGYGIFYRIKYDKEM
jgi:4-hydroxybenzoate polyprenyltransferase